MASGASVLDAKLRGGTSKGGKIGMMVFGMALVVGFIYAGAIWFPIFPDSLDGVMPFVLLGIALFGARDSSS